jgi:elongator complex protein 2
VLVYLDPNQNTIFGSRPIICSTLLFITIAMIQPADSKGWQDELLYAAISSNRNENNISCKGDLLLYSRCRSPIIYNLRTKLVTSILIGHSAEVNGQSFVCDDTRKSVDNKTNSVYVISTAHDCTAIIWQVDGAECRLKSDTDNYKRLYQIKSQDESLFTARCSILDHDGHFFSILTTMSGDVCLHRDEQLLQTISTKHCYFDSKFYAATYFDPVAAEHTSSYSLVALAGSGNRLHIYNLNSEMQLDHVQDLSGFNDWIKCLEFLPLPNRPNELLLAAACQDALIQVWLLKLTKHYAGDSNQVRTRVSKLDASGIELVSTLETVLSGHEGFVHSLCWFKKLSEKSNILQLASCSSDKTVIVWRSAVAKQGTSSTSCPKKYEQCPASEGVWQEVVRLGETGEANLPFIGVCLSEDESTLYAQSLRGAVHSWSAENNDHQGEDLWPPQETICGHFDSVTDLAWEKTGAYLLSSSLDKTCRLHAVAANDNRWHELARPQVHGYEINCLASLNFFKFASGAEEKTIRAFEVTKFFIKNYKALTKRTLPAFDESEESESQPFDELPAHAKLPALGLSNRGSQYPFDINETDNGAKQQTGESAGDKPTLSDNNSWQEVGNLVKHLAKIDHLDSLPYEEILLQSTLWWEKNKLFGHCNELHALDCNSNGSFLASASKANRPDLASIILWETKKFRKVATIEHHSLTVTRLRFSPDDKYLLSVSRDRTWCLCERNPSGQLRDAYKKLIGTVKTNAVHERIIWDCSWTYDSRYFLTVSRDKRAILWCVDDLRSQLKQLAAASTTASQASDNDNNERQAGHLKVMNLNYVSSRQFKGSIQAVDSARLAQQVDVNNESHSYLFVLGFEDGSIELHSVGVNRDNAEQQDQWQLLRSMTNLHQLSVRRLAFQPMQRHDENEETNSEISCAIRGDLILASGGDDCMVRLTRFYLGA